MRKLDLGRKFKNGTIALSLSLLVLAACNSSSHKEEKASDATTDTTLKTDEPMVMPDSTLMNSDTSKGGQPAPPVRN